MNSDMTVFTEDEIKYLKTTEEPLLGALYSVVLDEARKVRKSDAWNEMTPALLGFGFYTTETIGFRVRGEALLKRLSKQKEPLSVAENTAQLAACAELLSLFRGEIEPGAYARYLRAVTKQLLFPLLYRFVLPQTCMERMDDGNPASFTAICACAYAVTAIYDIFLPNQGYTPDELLSMCTDALGVWMQHRPLIAHTTWISLFDGAVSMYLRFATAYKRKFGAAPTDDTAFLTASSAFFASVATSVGTMMHPADLSGSTHLRAPLYFLRYGFITPEMHAIACLENDTDTGSLLRLLTYELLYKTPVPDLPPPPSVETQGTHTPVICRPMHTRDTVLYLHGEHGAIAAVRAGKPFLVGASCVLTARDDGYIFVNWNDCAAPAVKSVCDKDFSVVEATLHGDDFRLHTRYLLQTEAFALILDDCVTREPCSLHYHVVQPQNTDIPSAFRMLTFCDIVCGDTCKQDISVPAPLSVFYNRATDLQGHVRFLALLTFREPLTYEFDENTDTWRCSVTTEEDTYTFYFNPSTERRSMFLHAYETNALILIFRNGHPHAIVGGSFIRRKGVNIFNTYALYTGLLPKENIT